MFGVTYGVVRAAVAILLFAIFALTCTTTAECLQRDFVILFGFYNKYTYFFTADFAK